MPVIHTLDELLTAMRERKDQLGITYETLDHISGLQSGYSSKILCEKPSRRLGLLSFNCLLSSLGLELVVREDASQTKQIYHRYTKRLRSIREQWHVRL